ncbi:hypothetical protein GQ600_12775 [Phytophthora cactorum]|nr:hypothetical protein GQ600_12775 [Phytophthora cactorum]
MDDEAHSDREPHEARGNRSNYHPQRYADSSDESGYGSEYSQYVSSDQSDAYRSDGTSQPRMTPKDALLRTTPYGRSESRTPRGDGADRELTSRQATGLETKNHYSVPGFMTRRRVAADNSAGGIAYADDQDVSASDPIDKTNKSGPLEDCRVSEPTRVETQSQSRQLRPEVESTTAQRFHELDAVRKSSACPTEALHEAPGSRQLLYLMRLPQRCRLSTEQQSQQPETDQVPKLWSDLTRLQSIQTAARSSRNFTPLDKERAQGKESTQRPCC